MDNTNNVELLHLAADQGDAYAQVRLGLSYAKGEGVPQDYVEAYTWFAVAAAHGHPKATKYRNLVAKNLTLERLNQAQQRGTELFEKIEIGKG